MRHCNGMWWAQTTDRDDCSDWEVWGLTPLGLGVGTCRVPFGGGLGVVLARFTRGKGPTRAAQRTRQEERGDCYTLVLHPSTTRTPSTSTVPSHYYLYDDLMGSAQLSGTAQIPAYAGWLLQRQAAVPGLHSLEKRGPNPRKRTVVAVPR